MIKAFLIAIQFLTVFPIKMTFKPDDKSMALSLCFYPIVGLMIGCLLAFIAWLSQEKPPLLMAAIIVFAWVLLTGALHIDGLADSMDAWLGGLGDKDKTLKIMKDPYCGPIAVTAIVLLLLVKFTALFAVIKSGQISLIVLPPILGRLALLPLFVLTPYVNNNGLGAAIAHHISNKMVILVLIVSIIAIVLIVGLKSLWPIIAMLLIFFALRWQMMLRIGGMTGDTAGALVELTEVATLLSIALMLLP